MNSMLLLSFSRLLNQIFHLYQVRFEFSSVISRKSKNFLMVDTLCLIGDKFVMHPVSGVDMVLSEKIEYNYA